MSDDLQVVLPEDVRVVIRGQEIVIRRIKVRQLTQVMQAVVPFYDKLKAIKLRQNKDDVSIIRMDLFGLLADHGPDIFKVMAILSDRPIEYIEDLDLDEAVALFVAVLEVNLDFFTQKVLPSLSLLLGSLAASPEKAQLVGQTPSNS